MTAFIFAMLALSFSLKSFSQSHKVAEASNQFAFSFYKINSKVQGNLFFSPLSIETALAMAAAGAQEETLKQMLATLNLSPNDHAEFKSLLSQIKGSKNYQLLIANHIWAQSGVSFYPKFLSLLLKNYFADLSQLDFKKQTEASREKINKWVEQQTHDKIKDLLKPGAITSETALVLTNAIYFKGSWSQPFAKESTKEDDFQISASQKKTIRFMNKNADFRYFENSEFQYLQLPYQGQDLVMEIILPKLGMPIAMIEQKLTPQLFSSTESQSFFGEVAVSLPKFKAESELKLVPTLSSMGMPLVFDPSHANFGGMRKLSPHESLFISAAIHKAIVEVNEEGTEAAAATALVASAGMAPPSAPPKIFKADHPFLFFIRHLKSNAILFMGRYSQP